MLPASTKGPSTGASLRLPARLEGLHDQRVDVVGVGSVEGGEIAHYLLDAGFTRVVGHDLSPTLPELARAHRLAHAGLGPEAARGQLDGLLGGLAELHLGDRYLEGIGETSLVVPTQAWFLHRRNLELRRLREQGVPFYSLIQAYLDLCRGPVVGVTGSHGKSTTSALVARGLRAITPLVWLAGNDRHNQQALEAVARDEAGDGWLVLEISNRQLLQMDRAPHVGCITNITPNHLDEHGGMAAYVACKRRIYELPGCEVGVRNADDPVSWGAGPLPKGVRQVVFAQDEAALGESDGCYEEDGWAVVRRGKERQAVLELGALRLPGEHNRANVRAALALLAALDELPWPALPGAARALAELRPLPHRIQLVWQQDGVDYFDDLSSTTPQSTVAAVRTLAREVVLICGGEDKSIPFDQLAQMVGREVRQILLLPGSGSAHLLEAVRRAGGAALVREVDSLEEAVDQARSLARPGDAVLLSPACPGFFSAHYGAGGYRRALRRGATSPRPRRGPG